MINANNVQDYCSTMNTISIELQHEQELVSDIEVERALAYAKHLPLHTASDVVLFCASINLMNAYVKQGDHKKTFGYFFKAFVSRLLCHLDNTPIEGVHFYITEHMGMPLVLVSIYELQFSYHAVSYPTSHNGNLCICFDGIRRQPCAVTLFKMAESNPFLISEELPAPVPLVFEPQMQAQHAIGMDTADNYSAKNKQASPPIWRASAQTNTVWKDNPERKAQREKRGSKNAVPKVGDSISCEVARVGKSSIHVRHNGFRGLIPYEEMPDKWLNDVQSYVCISDEINAIVVAVTPSGFMKVSVKRLGPQKIFSSIA